MRSIFAILMVIFSGPALHAALISYNVTGRVSAATLGNVYGLQRNDSVRAYGIYDDTTLLPDSEFNPFIDSLQMEIGPNNQNTLFLEYGDITVDMRELALRAENLMDANQVQGSPRMVFLTGGAPELRFEWSGFVFGERDQQASNSVDLLYGSTHFTSWVSLLDKDGVYLGDTVSVGWKDDYTAAPVPIPGGIWLLGSVVAALLGLRRDAPTIPVDHTVSAC